MNLKALLLCTSAAIALVGCGNSDKPAAKLTPQSVTDKDFNKIDLNKDGTITYDEFDLSTDNKGDLVGNAVYVQIDKNGDGVIAKEEFTAPAPLPAITEAPAAAKPAPAKTETKAEKKQEPAKAAPAKTETPAAKK